jgi:hypothetical protein
LYTTNALNNMKFIGIIKAPTYFSTACHTQECKPKTLNSGITLQVSERLKLYKSKTYKNVKFTLQHATKVKRGVEV